MNKVIKHFQDEAGTFDSRVIKTVPFYLEMLEALVSAMPFKRDKKIKVIDLGCGTGTISKKVKEHYPNASIVCVDFSDNMMDIAKEKLKDYKDIDYVTCDCRKFDFPSGFDAVLSSLTLHHINKISQKKALYKKIYQGLGRQGVFYLADLALGPSKYLQKLNLKKWEEFMLRTSSRKDIIERKKRYESEDHPFKLIDEIQWLKEAGFRNIEVIWKYYHFAVFGGIKDT